ncbi:MarR family winged helix-turn-helix transcriptional regulator [Mucilaginibacter xinganensis]|uniref:DNA-binding transcriptional regulator, MarR family n=1 Tax=Mucilaginibacter xinganensis TaxID=1234841 RepID=A0A223NYN1_9SPHI|nr:MarR family transcriptional regulator [Mucilaginibacter xinganensis]ASU34890.1 DNA-binding transcriptional regulator, MarR family [Mucilaginibacter xinganensis]
MNVNESISSQLKRIARLYTRRLSVDLTNLKINGYYEVLLTLYDQKEFLTQKKLSMLLHIDKSRMVNIIYYLTQKGYTYVEQNKLDRREHFVFLSNKGEDIIPLIKSAVLKNNLLLRAGITENEFDSFMTVLSMVENNLLTAL